MEIYPKDKLLTKIYEKYLNLAVAFGILTVNDNNLLMYTVKIQRSTTFDLELNDPWISLTN